LDQLCAGFAWATGTIAVKRLVNVQPQFRPVEILAIQHATGVPILVIAAVPTGGFDAVHWSSKMFWIASIYVGVAFAASVAFYAALKIVNATRAASAQLQSLYSRWRLTCSKVSPQAPSSFSVWL
jgi:drug/metabolite transporter (DMT)-like permease